MEIYKIKDLSFTYPNSNKKALSNINLVIKNGDFITICGKSGSGKSSLIRQLKTIFTPQGKREGEILYMGQALNDVSHYIQAADIGYVFQSPDNQIVTDKVWHELAFGLESLGYDSKTIRLRVSEMAGYFGIENWFYKNVSELSGGQRQILNLASVMAMQPKVLMLDEPTAQLDPIAASDFIGTIKRLNEELGTTVIITEHRLEEIIPVTHKVVVLDEGIVIADGTPEETGRILREKKHDMLTSMTSAMQISGAVGSRGGCAITVNQGRRWLDLYLNDKTIKKGLFKAGNESKRPEKIIRLKDVHFRYGKNTPNVLKDFSMEIGKGEFLCILGGNGAGKSTVLSVMAGIYKPYAGKVFLNGKDLNKLSSKEKYCGNLAMLPQNPQNLFVGKTVEEDLNDLLADSLLTDMEKQKKIREVIHMTGLCHLMSMHPYDLSGGEQQRAALAKVLLMKPRILLLDEPTKGLDNFFKEKLAGILKTLTRRGITVVMVSHDIEFCARHGDRCALLFDGCIISENITRRFFSGNSFYTTAANRMARHIYPDAITVEDVILLCKECS